MGAHLHEGSVVSLGLLDTGEQVGYDALEQDQVLGQELGAVDVQESAPARHTRTSDITSGSPTCPQKAQTDPRISNQSLRHESPFFWEFVATQTLSMEAHMHACVHVYLCACTKCIPTYDRRIIAHLPREIVGKRETSTFSITHKEARDAAP